MITLVKHLVSKILLSFHKILIKILGTEMLTVLDNLNTIYKAVILHKDLDLIVPLTNDFGTA